MVYLFLIILLSSVISIGLNIWWLVCTIQTKRALRRCRKSAL